uniref:WD_REPEATS_REGION domain-containing protein n=1 Tax=Rhabditophanes sp. KR3021 TaxID=114890 RepID=A0AC35TRZ1_9BILA
MEDSTPKIQDAEDAAKITPPDLFVGALTGAVKAINIKQNTMKNLVSIADLVPKRDQIVRMCYTDEAQCDVLYCTGSNSICYYNYGNTSIVKLFSIDGIKDRLVGLASGDKDKIFTVFEGGQTTIYDNKGVSDGFSMNIGKCVQAVDTSRLQKEKTFAAGGKENELKIWDMARQQPIFTAKNVSHDFLNLRVPVNILSMGYCKGSDKIYTTTKKHQIRLYDPKAQAKPVMDLSWLENPITASSPGYEEHFIVVGNAIGEMGLFDTRVQRLVHKYKGAAGSIRSIAANPNAPLVASVGLDRFIRVHDMKKHCLRTKWYAKVKLSSVLMRDDLTVL